MLEYVDELEVDRVGADAVDDGEGEFALRQVLAHALVVAVFARRQVHVVVADLEDEPDDVDEGHAVDVCGRFGLHQLDAEAEQAAGLVAHHLEVVILRGASEGVSPEEVHALAAVQVEQLLSEQLDDVLVAKLDELLQRGKIYVVRGIDGLGDAEDVVGDGKAAAQLGRILDVVDQQRGFVEHAHDARDGLEALGGHVKEGVEGGDDLGAKVLARVAGGVLKRASYDVLLVIGPSAAAAKVEIIVGEARDVGRRRGIELVLHVVFAVADVQVVGGAVELAVVYSLGASPGRRLRVQGPLRHLFWAFA